MIHELIEAYMAFKKGLTDKQITKFDMDNPELDDPGLSTEAPYHKEHMAAMKIEAELAEILGVDWNDYEEQQIKAMKSYGKTRKPR